VSEVNISTAFMVEGQLYAGGRTWIAAPEGERTEEKIKMKYKVGRALPSYL
jgi:hypothetical protein